MATLHNTSQLAHITIKVTKCEEDDQRPAITNEDVVEEKLRCSSTSYSSSSCSSGDDNFNEDSEDFKNVTKPFLSYIIQNDTSDDYFLAGVPTRVHISECVRQPSSHRLNPNLYIIRMSHGKYKWTLKKRYNNFQVLQAHLELFYATMRLQHPNIANRMEKVPKFPFRPEITLQSERQKLKRMRKLQKFLQNVLNDDKFRNNKHTIDFVEVSRLSFVEYLGTKGKEGEVFKRAGGHTFTKGIFGNLKISFAWHKRWLVAKENFLAYIDKDSHVIRDVLLFDKVFKVSCDKSRTGIKNGLMISNNARNLLIKCISERQALEWMNDIVNTMGTSGCDWIRDHRYDSYAPLRRNNFAKWFIDGSDYFRDVADAIKTAKEEIFITDWWLSPELILKRPVDHLEKWRLDILLRERARNGVKIYILLYKEMEMALTINSNYTKKKMTSLHDKNIKVLRHPDHIEGPNATLLWAHHEKIVCIDQKLCFLGGFDLCYGRWDDNCHRLTDFGSATPTFTKKTDSAVLHLSTLLLNTDAIDSVSQREQLERLEQQDGVAKVFIGKDYCNPYVKDIADVEKPFTDLIDRNVTPRMPWHDIGAVVIGDPARDLARHFIQRWNFTKQMKAKEDQAMPFLLPKVDSIDNRIFEEFSDLQQCDVQIVRSCSAWSCGDRKPESSIYEAYLEYIKNAKYYIYIENQFFITSLHQEMIQNKIGDALVERILQAYYNKEVFRVYVVMPLLPCFPGELGTLGATSMAFIESWNLRSCNSIIQRLKTAGVKDPSEYISFYSLRNYADLTVKMVTEVVYVHSKMLLVDDALAIIGSANINDRSLLGTRDSELAVCIHDSKSITGVMNDKKASIGQFTSSLRRKIFQEHLGLLNQPLANVFDPISDHFYNKVWMEQAQRNTEIYEKVFRCIPTDEVLSYTDLESYKKVQSLNHTDPIQARAMLKDVRGFLVIKPLKFLSKQNCWPQAGTNESFVPVKVFT